LKKSTVWFGFGFISLKKPNQTQTEKNRKKTEPNRKTKPKRKNRAKTEKTEPNRKKPSQTGLNRFLS
jgi:hypothetical protein